MKVKTYQFSGKHPNGFTTEIFIEAANWSKAESFLLEMGYTDLFLIKYFWVIKPSSQE